MVCARVMMRIAMGIDCGNFRQGRGWFGWWIDGAVGCDCELIGEFRKAMDLHCDNKASIEISYNPIQHDPTKHVEVDCHFVKENLDWKIIQFPFVPSSDQLADDRLYQEKYSIAWSTTWAWLTSMLQLEGECWIELSSRHEWLVSPSVFSTMFPSL